MNISKNSKNSEKAQISIMKDSYNTIAERYLLTRSTGDKSEMVRGFQNREIEQPMMFSLVPKNLKNMNLLDIGCGPGIHITEYLKRGGICTGMDISERMIALAKQRCPKAAFFIGDISSTRAFKKSSFDIVTASFVLDHIKNLDSCFKSVCTVLKNNGRFIFSAPHPILNIFKDYAHSDFSVTRSYFDRTPIDYDIAKMNKPFPGYPRQLQEYFDIAMKNDFILERFVENKPEKEWKQLYGTEADFLFMVPAECFFVWRKKSL